MNDFSKKITVDTFEFPPGVINQTITGVFDKVVQIVIYTREASIREMLIKMGWTPPPAKNAFIPCPACGTMVANRDDGVILCSQCGSVFIRNDDDGMWHRCIIKEHISIEDIRKQADDATGIPRKCQKCNRPLANGCEAQDKESGPECPQNHKTESELHAEGL